MSIGEVDDVWSRTALPMSKADAVLEDHVGGVVLSQVLVHFQGADLVKRLVMHQLRNNRQHKPFRTSDRAL